jgi:hypothetical protein
VLASLTQQQQPSIPLLLPHSCSRHLLRSVNHNAMLQAIMVHTLA